ncbi:posphoenolpyruvate synthetase regulatory kinase/phosphorylase PpsR [Nitrosospira multiformis]|nr:pyruvate, water dikinase regulatory protein [Nitrosospira multiformis]
MPITTKPFHRTAFFLSDRTGITVEMLGHSLLSQFENIPLDEITLPYIDSREKATAVVRTINERYIADGARPLVFSTFVNPGIKLIVDSANALHLDCFSIFIAPLEAELGMRSSENMGRSHRVSNTTEYRKRIDAIKYALEHDDGLSQKDWNRADVTLVGVSRTGKTPTCLYLALQYGICAANYPLIPEDFQRGELPAQIRNMRSKLFGFTIHPERLHEIRSERKPESVYASLRNCKYEVQSAEKLMRRAGIPYLDATSKSIEELATAVLHEAKLERKIY